MLLGIAACVRAQDPAPNPWSLFQTPDPINIKQPAANSMCDNDIDVRSVPMKTGPD